MQTLRNLFLSDEIEGKVVYVLGIVIFIQFIYPITESGDTTLYIIYQMLYFLLMAAGFIVAQGHRGLMRLLAVFAVTWIIGAVIFTFNQTSVLANVIGYISYAVFQGVVTWVLMRYLFTAKTVTKDVLFAAIAVYLLLGALFVPTYGLLDTLTFELSNGQQHAFVGGVSDEAQVFAWQDFVYYSYVTLTTLGYGDILPVTMLAKAVVSFEAIVGVMYITIIMARLVSLYSAEANRATA